LSDSSAFASFAVSIADEEQGDEEEEEEEALW